MSDEARVHVLSQDPPKRECDECKLQLVDIPGEGKIEVLFEVWLGFLGRSVIWYACCEDHARALQARLRNPRRMP